MNPFRGLLGFKPIVRRGPDCGCEEPACGCEASTCDCPAPACGCETPACGCATPRVGCATTLAPVCGVEAGCGCSQPARINKFKHAFRQLKTKLATKLKRRPTGCDDACDSLTLQEMQVAPGAVHLHVPSHHGGEASIPGGIVLPPAPVANPIPLPPASNVVPALPPAASGMAVSPTIPMNSTPMEIAPTPANRIPTRSLPPNATNAAPAIDATMTTPRTTISKDNAIGNDAIGEHTATGGMASAAAAAGANNPAAEQANPLRSPAPGESQRSPMDPGPAFGLPGDTATPLPNVPANNAPANNEPATDDFDSMFDAPADSKDSNSNGDDAIDDLFRMNSDPFADEARAGSSRRVRRVQRSHSGTAARPASFRRVARESLQRGASKDDQPEVKTWYSLR
ncbi:MAG: hypothetical protein AAF958_09250 [Planctomycetota bacterium]